MRAISSSNPAGDHAIRIVQYFSVNSSSIVPTVRAGSSRIEGDEFADRMWFVGHTLQIRDEYPETCRSGSEGLMQICREGRSAAMSTEDFLISKRRTLAILTSKCLITKDESCAEYLNRFNKKEPGVN